MIKNNSLPGFVIGAVISSIGTLIIQCKFTLPNSHFCIKPKINPSKLGGQLAEVRCH